MRTLKVYYNRISIREDIKTALRRIFIGYKGISRTGFRKWKTFTEKCKHGEVMDRMTSAKLQHKIEKITFNQLRIIFFRIIGKGNNSYGMLSALFVKCSKVPRDALKSWKNYIENVKNHKLLDNSRAQSLKSTLSHLSLKTLRLATKRLINENSIVKVHIIKLLSIHKKGKKFNFGKWKEFVENTKKGTLLDVLRTEKLKSRLLSINRRVLRNCLQRILGDGSTAKGALRTIFLHAEKLKKIQYLHWKNQVNRLKLRESMIQVKGFEFLRVINRTLNRKLRGVSDRIVGRGSRTEGALRRLYTCLKIKYMNAFRDWKQKTRNLKARDEKIIRILSLLVFKITNRTLKTSLKAIVGDSRIKAALNKIIINHQALQKQALMTLSSRVAKVQTIGKINSAYFVFRSLLTYIKKVKSMRFSYWKNLEIIRRAIIMKKTAGKMMGLMSINFEGAFWKWKYIMTHTERLINPKHSIVIARLSKVGKNYQKRLSQFGFFKLILYLKGLPFGQRVTLPQMLAKKDQPFHHRASLSQALVKIFKPAFEESFSQTPEKYDLRPLSNTSELKHAENPSNVSTVAAGLSKEEVSSMTQMGAFEILFLTFKEVKLRRSAWALSAIFTFSKQVGFYDGERSRLIEQITELRYEKHSLLEDNNTLRHHNDSLVNSLEKANDEFQTIALNLDHLRLNGMIRILSRLAEISMHSAFIHLSIS